MVLLARTLSSLAPSVSFLLIKKLSFSKIPFRLTNFHTLDNGKQPANGGPIPSTSSGTTVAVTFNTNGTYPYYCDIHASSGMFGVVYVGNQCAGQSSPAGNVFELYYLIFELKFFAPLHPERLKNRVKD
jgi:hypothetical protein